MATVIDALIVSLNLDPSGFTKGQKDTAASLLKLRKDSEDTAKELERRGRQAAEFYNQVRTAAAGFFAYVTGERVLSHFSREAAAGDAAVGRLARTLGIATDRLNAYQQMAERVGGTREGVSGSLSAIQNQIQGFVLRGDPLPNAYRALGIRLADDEGRQRSSEDIYKDVIEALRRRPVREHATILNDLGLGAEVSGFAQMAPAEFQRRFGEQMRLGTVTQQQAEAGQRLLEAWLNLNQAIETTWRALRLGLEPGISAVLKGLTDLTTWVNGETARPLLDKVNDALREFGAYLGGDRFKQDLAAFGRQVGEVVRALGRLLEFLGILPGQANAASLSTADALTGETAMVSPTAPSPGARGVGDFMRRTYEWNAFGGTGAGSDRVEDNHRTAYDFFVGRGYTPEQAAGLVANLHHESGVNPQIRAGDGGRSHGIGQWNGERLERFRQRYGGRMPRETTLQEQLEFAEWELSENGPEAAAGRALRAAREAREAGEIASRRWLRPGRDEAARNAEALSRGLTASNFLPDLRIRPRAAQPARPALPAGPEAAEEPGRNPSWPPGYDPRVRPPAVAPAPPRQWDLSGLDPALRGGAGLTASARNAATINNSSRSTSTELTIGSVTVQTAATDARGIADGFGRALMDRLPVQLAAQGLV
ncbi:phage tail tip lysozyme [Roseomonas sp. CCTCC AB2023176]|uniref:phage tail tip lysozyme n=1 Tax=Roseomonas sp. CCTCC AB2023176 TaxID=3342640 RepID=UPI0035E0AC21